MGESGGSRPTGRTPSQPVRSEPSVLHQSWRRGARGSEGTGRGSEPRHGERCGPQDSPPREGGESRRRPGAGRPQSWVREGEGPGHPRGLSAGPGSSGVTRARGRATTRLGNGRIGEPGEHTSAPSRVAWSCDLAGSEAAEHPRGRGARGTPAGRRDGVVAVVAAQRTAGLRASAAGREGGEPRPTGPTGGKATPGSTVCWEDRGEPRRGHPPSPRHSSGERRRRCRIPRGGARRWPTGGTSTGGGKPLAGPAQRRRRGARG